MTYHSESNVQSRIRLEASRLNMMFWRNNSGACKDQTGRVIRYGLGNDSQRINAAIKSSDLIGIVPVVIQPHHVGQVFGVFGAVECKRSDWNGPSGDREAAQERFLALVRQYGGRGTFATCEADLQGLLG